MLPSANKENVSPWPDVGNLFRNTLGVFHGLSSTDLKATEKTDDWMKLILFLYTRSVWKPLKL